MKVKSENEDDKVVLTEMDKQINSNKVLLRHYFIDAVYTDDVVWYDSGRPVRINNKKEFNQLLSSVIDRVYPDTPVFKNELVNRNKISPTIHTARKEFYLRLVNNWSENDFGYDDNFPADKTIYISLLRENGIHRRIRNNYSLAEPNANSTFATVWNACEQFLASTKSEKDWCQNCMTCC
ncbi:MAG: hypothetical protein IPJ79_01210 [Bacteroidetes bacterium]|nr:hypothetical protein [Bacteroidota bacterium]